MSQHQGLLNLDVTADGFLRAAAKCATLPQGLETAIVRALNKTVLGMRTDGSRLVRKEYAVPVKDALGLAMIMRANKSHLKAELKFRGSANISLGHFSPRPVRVRDSRGRARTGVSVLVKRSSGRKKLGQGFQPKPGGPIFAREGSDRLPLRKLFTSAPVRFLGRPEVSDELLSLADVRLAKNFDHESRWVLEQAGVR